MRPRLIPPALLLAGVLAAACTPASPAAGAFPVPDDADRVLVVVDALRADRLERPEVPTPHLDRLVGESLVFPRALAQGMETRTAMPVLLCGLGGGACLGDRYPRHARGWFNTNAWLGPPLDAGFQHRSFVSHFHGEPRVDGSHLAAEFAGWLAGQDGPVLAFLHFMDVHAPYGAPGGDCVPLSVNGPVPVHAGPEDLACTVRRYDEGVARFDGILGEVLAALDARGRPGVLVLTADHGESLGEHGLLGHGRQVVPEVVRVPLVVRTPARTPGRVEVPVAQAEILGLLDGRGATGGEVRIRPGALARWPRLLAAEATWDLEAGTSGPPRRVQVDLGDFPAYAPPADASGRMRALGYLDPETPSSR